MFAIPVDHGRFVIYAPLRQVAFVGNTRIVNILAQIGNGDFAASSGPDIDFTGISRSSMVRPSGVQSSNRRPLGHDLGRVFLNPAVTRRMVDRDAALAHHLLEITIAHPVAAIPPDRPEHDLSLEVAPLEIRHGPLPFLAHAPSRQTMAGFATEPPKGAIQNFRHTCERVIETL